MPRIQRDIVKDQAPAVDYSSYVGKHLDSRDHNRHDGLEEEDEEPGVGEVVGVRLPAMVPTPFNMMESTKNVARTVKADVCLKRTSKDVSPLSSHLGRGFLRHLICFPTARLTDGYSKRQQ